MYSNKSDKNANVFQDFNPDAQFINISIISIENEFLLHSSEIYVVRT